MARSGKVVELTSRPGYGPDCAALARRQIVAARNALGLSTAEFAAKLTPMVGWPVHASTVDQWETDATPSGDILVAASTLVSDGDTSWRVGRLVDSVPPSFSAETLNGLWVTCFRFGPGPARKAHVDVASVDAESDRLLRITNRVPVPRSEGRASPFCNDLEAQLANRHILGQWKNSNDQRYFGLFHLAVLPGETVMAGVYTGFGSDIEVSTGPWKWVRLDADSLAGADLSAVRLGDPANLGERIETHSQYAAPLTLDDITEEP